MASTKLTLDTRRPKKDGTCPLKLSISQHNRVSYLSLNVSLLPTHWDEVNGRVVVRSDRQGLNSYISERKHAVDGVILSLIQNGNLNRYSAQELKDYIAVQLTPEDLRVPDVSHLFSSHFLHVADRHNGRTRETYLHTFHHLQKFMGPSLNSLRFEDISKDWLMRFDKYLERTSPSRNARNIHFRNIRAVFNDAIDNDITTAYPFRKFKIKDEATAKRSLTLEQLRQLFSFPCEPCLQHYVDMFKLSFFLIGINLIDLCHLKDITNGRIEYHRAKTHKLYSIKVEPEALAIIEKYRGKSALLNISDHYKNYRDYSLRINRALKHVGPFTIGKKGKKTYTPLFPLLSTYWARHTWATIASELDIPDDTISRALGHSQTSGARVTQVYINFNNKKIDEANRRVIDYVLYGKT